MPAAAAAAVDLGMHCSQNLVLVVAPAIAAAAAAVPVVAAQSVKPTFPRVTLSAAVRGCDSDSGSDKFGHRSLAPFWLTGIGLLL